MNPWLDDELVAVEDWMVATSSADVPLAAAAAKLLLVLVLVLLLLQLLLQAWAAGPLRISTSCGPKHLDMPTLNGWTMNPWLDDELVAVEDWMVATSSTDVPLAAAAAKRLLVLLLLLLLLQAWAWAYCYCCCWCCYCCCWCWAGEASALPWVLLA